MNSTEPELNGPVSARAPTQNDETWLELVRELTQDGRYFFTANQLYLAYARNKVVVTRFIARRGMFGLCMIAVGLATWVYALKADWGLTLVLGIATTLGGVALVGTGVVTRRDPAPRAPVEQWLERWSPSEGSAQLVDRPTLEQASADLCPATARSLIIVERELVVDLLLRNGAQHDLSALIVSESGYPVAVLRETKRRLRETPPLKVVALHDATAHGVQLAARLQKSERFALGDHEFVDAGLFPADVTWLAELAPAIPAAHTNHVPIDSLSYPSLLNGLRGVLDGAMSLHAALSAAADEQRDEPAAAEPTLRTQ